MKHIKTFETLNKKEYNIILSARRGSLSGVDKALKTGDDINTKDQFDRTPLMVSVLNRYISVVEYLIKQGANVNLQDKDGRTSLMMASTMRIINALLNAGADVNITSNKGENVIMDHLTYESKSEKFIEYLLLFLEKGLNLDQRNNKGENLYDMIKIQEKTHTGESYKLKYYFEVEDFMNSYFPKYKEEWEIKQNMDKYNL